jgi:hypothetical protein
MGSSASPIVLLVLQIPGRFPVVRAKLLPLAFPSSFYPMSILAMAPIRNRRDEGD